MPYNGRYYCNSVPKYKILVTEKEGEHTVIVTSATTYSMNDYYEIFDDSGDPFTDKAKAERVAEEEREQLKNEKTGQS